MAKWLVYLALTVAQCGFGGYTTVLSIFSKGTNTDPMVHMLIRDFFATLIIFLLAVCFERKVMVPNRREIPFFMVTGFLGFFLSRCAFIWGVYFTSAGIASIFVQTTPVWTYVIATVTKMEPFPDFRTVVGATRIFGFLLAIGGATTMCVGKDDDDIKFTQPYSKQALGYFALFVHTISYAAFLLFQKKFMYSVESSARWKKHPFNTVFWYYINAYIFIFLSNIYNMVERKQTFTELKVEAIYALAYGCLINSVLCFSLIIWSNMRAKSTLVASFFPLQTISGVMIAYLALGEKLNVIEIIGGICIMIALIGILWADSREEKELESDKQADNDCKNKELLVTTNEEDICLKEMTEKRSSDRMTEIKLL